MARDQYGVSNRDTAPTESSGAALPDRYRITNDRFGLALWRDGKLVRASASCVALVQYAHRHAAHYKEAE